MAIRKPLVLLNGGVTQASLVDGGSPLILLDGYIAQLPEGDTLEGANVIVVGGGGDIQRDRDIIERNEYVLPQGSLESLVLSVPDEFLPYPMEEVVAALLARAEEIYEQEMERTSIEVSIVPEVSPIFEDYIQILPTANEEYIYSDKEEYDLELYTYENMIQDIEYTALDVYVPNEMVHGFTDSYILDTYISDFLDIANISEYYLLSLGISESSNPILEDTPITVGINDVNFELENIIDTYQLITASSDIVPTQLDEANLVTVILEDPIENIIDDVKVLATVTSNELIPEIVEDITATIVEQDNFLVLSPEEAVISIDLEGYIQAVVSNTGFTNPNNVIGNTTNTAATLTATSSGLLGTTNNTTNGTLVASFNAINLGDLSITSVVFRIESQHANAGVPITQPTTNIQYQYSTNNGSTWTTFYTQTANTAKAIRTVDITSIIGQNQTLLNQFRVRATGNVTSGTGLGAGSTASFFRAWLSILANRTYL